MDEPMDLPSVILDEIALEGLDGLTVQGLFERLRTRQGFNILVDEDSKPFLWNITRKLRDVQGFFLSQPRRALIAYDRRDFIDERGNVFEPAFLQEDIYEYSPIHDVEANIRGSCKEYKTRREVVLQNLSYAAAIRNEHQLVLVALQPVREKMFLPEGQDVEANDLTIVQYCMLERIARARYQGEATRGKVSMNCMKIEPKSLFYQRKFLMKKGLIIKQGFAMKFGEMCGNSPVNIFHIPRFYTVFESHQRKVIRNMIAFLLTMPNREYPSAELKKTFGKNNYQLLISKEYSLITEQIDREQTSAVAGRPSSKTYLAVRLIHPNVTPENFTQFLPEPADEPKDIEETGRAIIPTVEVHSQTSLLYDVLSRIMDSKSEGVNVPGITDEFNITQLDARSAIRQIQSYKNALVTSLQDKKKTKIQQFIFYKFKKANKIYESLLPSPTKSKPSLILPDIEVSSISEEPAIYFNTEKRRIKEHELTTLPIKPAVLKLIEDVKSNGLMESSPDTNGVLFVVNATSQSQIPLPPTNDFFSYETTSGWNIVVELFKSSDPEYPNSTPPYSTKGIDRLNTVISFIYESNIIIGSAALLKRLRSTAITEEGLDVEVVDRRTLFRLLGHLFQHDIIKIFKISLQKEDIIRSVHVFLPSIATPSCPLMIATVDSLIQTIQRRIKLSREEKALRKKKNALINSAIKVSKNRAVKIKPVMLKTGEKAKRGRKRNEAKIRAAKPKKFVKARRQRIRNICRDQRYRAYYDEIDKHALSMMTRQRVIWDNEEDCYILCLFLATVLFTPKYDYSKIYIFNAAQIRNILHSLRPDSEMKTTLAIRRRIHFLMRNHNFLHRYRYYLNESLQDKTLLEKYIQPYTHQLGDKIYPEIPTEPLTNLFSYILNKFNKSTMFKSDKLPREISMFQGVGFEGRSSTANSLQLIREYSSKIAVVDGRQDLQDKLSIFIWTARSALMSLIFGGDAISHVQSLLDNIHDDVLNFTITHLRNLGITTFQKKTHRFCASQVMKRKFQVYLSPQKFRDSRNLLSLLEKRGSHGHLDCSNQISTGSVTLLTELLTCGSVDCEIKMVKPLYKIHDDWKEVFDEMPDDDDEVDSGDEDQNQGQSSFKSPAKKPRLELVKPPEESNEHKLTRLIRISTRGMQLMRSRMHQKDPSACLDKNFFSINLPKIRIKLLPDFYRLNFFMILDLPTLEQRLVKVTPLLCSTEEEKLMAQVLTSKRRLGKYLVLYQYINAAKEVGLSLLYLKTKFTRDTLTNGLKYLMENSSVFLVGTTIRKFVTIEYVYPWTMPLPKKKSFITQRVIMRPWIQSSGEVNWCMLDHSFTAIIGHMNLYPDLSVQYLCSKLQPILSPVETMILLDILYEMHMFGFYKLNDTRSQEDVLFSKPRVISKEYVQDPFLDMENLEIELFPLIITKYSLFQQAFRADKSFETDIFADAALFE